MRAEDFFALKNPKVSVGFEHPNLGTKGQHAHTNYIVILLIYLLRICRVDIRNI